MKKCRNWAPPGVMREYFTASDFESSRPDGRFTSSLGYLMRAIRAVEPKLSFDKISDPAEFPAWKQAVRDKLRELLRMRTELEVEFKLLAEEKRDGYRLFRYEFYPEDFLAVPIIMVVPEDVIQTGRRVPAVICSPGSGAGLDSLAGEPDDNYNRYPVRNKQAWWYARAGMIGIAIENPATAYNSVDGVEYGQVQSKFFQLLPLAGKTYHGFVTEQRLMIIEFLKKHPLVDASRSAVSGMSLGCGGVLYTALMSDDVSAAVYNDFVFSFVQRVLCCTEISSGPNLATAVWAGGAEWFDIIPDLMAALAPLPLCLPEGGVWTGHVEKVLRAYEMAGASDQVDLHYYNKYADPASRKHDGENLREVTGLSAYDYLVYANVDAEQHSFHPEVVIPFICRTFYGKDYQVPAQLQQEIEAAAREKAVSYI